MLTIENGVTVITPNAMLEADYHNSRFFLDYSGIAWSELETSAFALLVHPDGTKEEVVDQLDWRLMMINDVKTKTRSATKRNDGISFYPLIEGWRSILSAPGKIGINKSDKHLLGVTAHDIIVLSDKCGKWDREVSIDPSLIPASYIPLEVGLAHQYLVFRNGNQKLMVKLLQGGLEPPFRGWI